MKRHLLLLVFGACLAAFAAVKPINSQMIVLKPGWNLVTLERPIVASDAEQFLALRPMMLNAARKCLVCCEDREMLKIGAGYWIHVNEAKTLELMRDQSQTTWETVGLRRGWNLVGVADNSTWQTQATEIWQWADGKFQIITKDELVEGKAYWVKD